MEPWDNDPVSFTNNQSGGQKLLQWLSKLVTSNTDVLIN